MSQSTGHSTLALPIPFPSDSSGVQRYTGGGRRVLIPPFCLAPCDRRQKEGEVFQGYESSHFDKSPLSQGVKHKFTQQFVTNVSLVEDLAGNILFPRCWGPRRNNDTFFQILIIWVLTGCRVTCEMVLTSAPRFTGLDSVPWGLGASSPEVFGRLVSILLAPSDLI